MKSILKNKLIAILALALASSIAPQAFATTLMGDTVNASMGSVLTIDTQFSPSETVGAGIEFTGVLTDAFGQIWDLSLDVADTSFVLGITERTRGVDGNVLGPSNLFTLSLASLDFLGGAYIDGVANSNYSCTGGFGCNTFGGGPSITNLNFGDDFINLSLNTLRHGEVYTFDIATAVPAPLSLLLMSLGLIGLGLFRPTPKA